MLYFSEYDMQAVSELGFRTRNAAIQTISEQVGSGNNYLKLRRDEFDALPDSASQRKGWRNRAHQSKKLWSWQHIYISFLSRS